MTVVAWLLAFFPVASWLTTLVLIRAALQPPPVRFLTAVAVASALGSLGGTLLAPLAIARMTGIPIDPPIPGFLLVAAVLIFSLPGPAFLVAYIVGWFDAERST